jgi:cysteinyl-tRNA synthetase
VRYWLHNGFVNVDKEKMSKSIGNVLLVNELLKQASGEAIRMALLSAHYRQPLDWTDDGLDQATKMLDRLYGAARALGDVDAAPGAAPDPDFIAALNDDLNTPKAMAALFELARQANTASDPNDKSRIKGTLLASAGLMGLLEQDPEEWFAGESGDEDGIDAAEIEALIDARKAARAAKDFAESDRIRDELAAIGITLEDGPDGTKWRRG